MPIDPRPALFRYPKWQRVPQVSFIDAIDELSKLDRAFLGHLIRKFFPTGVSSAELVRCRPWSQTYKVKNNDQIFYLKIPQQQFMHESETLLHVTGIGVDILPDILGFDPESGAFITSEIPGTTLRSVIREGVKVPLISNALNAMADLQYQSRAHIRSLDNSAIPLWNPSGFGQAYLDVLNHENYRANSHLSTSVLDAVTSKRLEVECLVSKIIDGDGGLAIEHGDFQGNNIIVSNEEVRVLDWADASVTAPSLLLATFWHSYLLAHRIDHGSNKELFELARAYLSRLTSGDSPREVAPHLTLLHHLYPIYCILKTRKLLDIVYPGLQKFAVALIDYWVLICTYEDMDSKP